MSAKQLQSKNVSSKDPGGGQVAPEKSALAVLAASATIVTGVPGSKSGSSGKRRQRSKAVKKDSTRKSSTRGKRSHSKTSLSSSSESLSDELTAAGHKTPNRRSPMPAHLLAPAKDDEPLRVPTPEVIFANLMAVNSALINNGKKDTTDTRKVRSAPVSPFPRSPLHGSTCADRRGPSPLSSRAYSSVNPNSTRPKSSKMRLCESAATITFQNSRSSEVESVALAARDGLMTGHNSSTSVPVVISRDDGSQSDIGKCSEKRMASTEGDVDERGSPCTSVSGYTTSPNLSIVSQKLLGGDESSPTMALQGSPAKRRRTDAYEDLRGPISIASCPESPLSIYLQLDTSPNPDKSVQQRSSTTRVDRADTDASPEAENTRGRVVSPGGRSAFQIMSADTTGDNLN